MTHKKLINEINKTLEDEDASVPKEAIDRYWGLSEHATYVSDDQLKIARKVDREYKKKKTKDYNFIHAWGLNKVLYSFESKHNAYLPYESSFAEEYFKTQIKYEDKPKQRLVNNVMDYGAKGDGITNDTQAFIDAFRHASYLEIPEGHTFKIDPLFNRRFKTWRERTLKEKLLFWRKYTIVNEGGIK